MDWIFQALLVAILYAILDIGMRVVSQKTANTRAFSFVYNSWGSITALLFLLLQGQSVDISSLLNFPVLALIIITTILYGGWERFQFIARKHVEASTLAIILTITPVTAFISSIIVLGEQLTAMKVLGLICIVGASMSIASDKFRIRNKGVLTAILCATILGFAATASKALSEAAPLGLVNAAVWTTPLMIILVPYIPMSTIINELKIGGWKLAILAVINVTGYYLMIDLFSRHDASIIFPIISSSSVMSVLGGIFILNEKTNITKKIIAAIIAFIGIYILRS